MTERFHNHIALLSAEFPPTPGGVGDYTRRLGEALAARGARVTALTIEGGALVAVALPDGRRTPLARAAGWGWEVWRAVDEALAALRPDVLHIQYQTGAYAMRPAVNFLPRRLRGRLPVAVTAHDLLPPYLFPKAGPLRGWVTRRILADAGAAVVTNEDDQATARGWGVGAALIPIGSNIAVAPPPGYERAAWRARLGVAEGELLVAYFGLISRSKGLGVLLDAVERLAGARLLVVGGEATATQDRAYAAEVRARIAGGPLAERVTITGHCAEDEVSAHLLAADAAALPFSDGTSFRRGSLLAALAHGLPVVTTRAEDQGPTTKDQQPRTNDQGPRTEQTALLRRPRAPDSDVTASSSTKSLGLSSFVLRPLEDGVSALLVPPEDAGALAGALGRLAGEAALRARIGAGGRAVAAQFGWDAIAARHEELYRTMAISEPSAPPQG